MVYHQFLKQAQQQPHAIAVCAGEQQISYSQLNQKIIELSTILSQQSVSSSSVVATALPNSIEFVVATFAIFKLGATLLPLNVNYTDVEVQHYLKQAKVTVVVTSATQLSRIKTINDKIIVVDVDSQSHIEEVEGPDSIDLNKALIMFSSGSTGGAKQVTRSFQNLIAEWVAARETMQITNRDVILCSVPLHHTHGFGNCLLASLLNGAKLVITKGEFNPRSVIRTLVQHKVSIYPSASFMLKMLGTIRLRESPDLTHLRLVYSAGGPLDLNVIETFKDTFNITPYQLYGSTETGAATINLGSAPLDSVGKPVVNTDIAIVDKEGNKLGVEKEGEIIVSSPASASCYDENPEQSATTFKNGFYYTGDLGYLDEQGNLYITGRKKKMINVAGLKVDPSEVESVILNIDEVSEVVVLGKPDGDYGELVKAVIVAKSALGEDKIIKYCKQHLAEYKWPKIIEFRAEIPKSPLGKILKKYL